MEQTREHPNCIIYAATALTRICVAHAPRETSVDVVTRPDVFLHLSGLLRAQFPHAAQKLAVFSNVVRMLAPAVQKVGLSK